ncbi:hypothetical protein DID88_002578 [Monilinia fructigena]|uniref:Uncharacterized protein n=1 Tax=Monilinia fructigena TaxID=38457 RepID=A0A395IP82_9HELO|nr:hypothetical protein DID88_002578 [Monilinia fructigena]
MLTHPQPLSTILHKAGFVTLKDFMQAISLRIWENEHILRAWDMLEGMRGDYEFEEYHEAAAAAAVEKSVEVRKSGGVAADIHSDISKGGIRK